MFLAILLVVLLVPQLVGYAVMRLSRRPSRVEWVAAAVATFTAIWFATCGHRASSLDTAQVRCGMGEMISYGLLMVGLGVEIFAGMIISNVVISRREPPPAPPAA